MKNFVLFILVGSLIAAITLHVRYGGGEHYRDLSSTPVISEARIETVLQYAEPIGNVAVSPTGRLFFTVHPESRPRGNKLLEWVDGAATPYPSGTVQPHLFDTVLGLSIDQHDRLWTIDHGNHGFGTARLLAFNLATGELVHDHSFKPEIAPAGSLLQDLAISADGRTVYIADASLWRKRPALIVYDVASRSARRVLQSHNSVSAENFLIRNPIRDMSFFGGLITLKTGVDGLTLDAENKWLYFAAINNSGLYRVPIRGLIDPVLPERDLEQLVERFSDKPLSAGIRSDLQGNIFITDVEHGAVLRVSPQRTLSTIVKSPRLRWPDSIANGPDGWLYLADSAIPEQILQTTEHISDSGPYFIFRFQPQPENYSDQ